VPLYRVLLPDVLLNITGLDRTGALFSPNRVLSQTEADILGPLVILISLPFHYRTYKILSYLCQNKFRRINPFVHGGSSLFLSLQFLSRLLPVSIKYSGYGNRYKFFLNTSESSIFSKAVKSDSVYFNSTKFITKTINALKMK
jgi:hypothetical protein